MDKSARGTVRDFRFHQDLAQSLLMKSLPVLIVFSLLVGLGIGAVLAYVEVPATVQLVQSKPSEQPVAEESVLAFPKAEVPETVYNFGKIERGASMTHVFKIRNVGEAPLRVDVTSTTCKCTVGDLSKNEIGPNEESDVLLEWVAKTGPGPFRHGAILSTNDPKQSSIELTVEGQVVESSSMSSSEMIFGTVRVGESATANIYLMAFLDQDVKVLDYEISDEALAEKIEINITQAEPAELPSPDAVSGVKIAATYRSGKTVGPFRGWLTMTTNLEKAEKLTVLIAGRVQGNLSVFGPGWNDQRGLLRMGSFASAEGKSVRLNLAVRGDDAQQANWEVAEVDPPQLKVSIEEPRVMKEKLVHVPLLIEVPAGTKPMVRLGEPTSSDAKVVLRSNHPGIPDMQLWVRFAVE